MPGRKNFSGAFIRLLGSDIFYFEAEGSSSHGETPFPRTAWACKDRYSSSRPASARPGCAEAEGAGTGTAAGASVWLEHTDASAVNRTVWAGRSPARAGPAVIAGPRAATSSIVILIFVLVNIEQIGYNSDGVRVLSNFVLDNLVNRHKGWHFINGRNASP
jgi:hypothetical protein